METYSIEEIRTWHLLRVDGDPDFIDAMQHAFSHVPKAVADEIVDVCTLNSRLCGLFIGSGQALEMHPDFFQLTQDAKIKDAVRLLAYALQAVRGEPPDIRKAEEQAAEWLALSEGKTVVSGEEGNPTSCESRHPRRFESLTPEQRDEIVNQRRDETLVVSKQTANVASLQGMEESHERLGYVQIGASSPALTDEGARQIDVEAVVRPGPGILWGRFAMRVYRNGGRIFYRELTDTDLEAVVQFGT